MEEASASSPRAHKPIGVSARPLLSPALPFAPFAALLNHRALGFRATSSSASEASLR